MEIETQALTTCEVAPDGGAISLGFVDSQGKPATIRLSLNQVGALAMTLPGLIDKALQTRFGDQLSVNAGAGYTFGHNADVINETTLVDHESHANGTPNLNAALNYHFIPNILVGSVTYQHDFGGGSDNLYAVTTDDPSVRNKSEDLLGVRLRYVLQ